MNARGTLERDTAPVLHSHVSRLSYADTDPAGILYYAAWFPRMEALVTEFFYLNDLRQDTLLERFGWWTVTRATSCEYLSAAKLFDEIRIDVRVGTMGTSSFNLDFTMQRIGDGVIVARASYTLVAVGPEQLPVRIPAMLRERLESWKSSGA